MMNRAAWPVRWTVSTIEIQLKAHREGQRGSFLLLLLRQQSCAVEQRNPPSYVTVPKEAAGRFEDIAKGWGANRALGMVHRNYNGQVGKHTSEADKQYCSQSSTMGTAPGSVVPG
ncbi:hypothetical protein MHYP_G00313580 [Metynnis hypsauchen]